MKTYHYEEISNGYKQNKILHSFGTKKLQPKGIIHQLNFV